MPQSGSEALYGGAARAAAAVTRGAVGAVTRGASRAVDTAVIGDRGRDRGVASRLGRR